MGFRHSPDALEPGAALSPVRPYWWPCTVKTDRLMLSPWPGEAAVGLYGAAGSISALWIFVPAALVETARPLLLARFRQDPAGFRRGWPLCMAYSGMAPAWPPW